MGRGSSGLSGGSGGINQQFKNIADAIESGAMPITRAYFDIPNAFADSVFNKYDPSDLYSYLTQKEQKQAFKDLQGINANSTQVQMEWMKKAIWRIAKKKAWNELEEW